MKNRLYYGLILVFAIVIYGNTIPNKYALDDLYVTGANEQITKGIQGIPEILTSFYADNEAYRFAYRPVVKVTYAVEYEFFGQNPHMSHAINLLLYAFAGILLFRFFNKKMIPSINPVFPFLVVLLFMSHPVHTEVVASLKNRDELLSFIFSWLSIYSIFNYVDYKKWHYIPLGLVFFFLAYLSKPGAIVYIALLPLCLYFFREINWKRLVWITASIIVIALIARYLPRWILPSPNRGTFFIENPLFFEGGFAKRIGTGSVTLLHYLKMLIYPHPMVFYYGFDMIPIVGMFSIWSVVSILIHGGLFVIALLQLRKKTLLSFGILFYLISISMFSNILKPAMGIVAERYMFTAVLGFSFVVIYLLFKLFNIAFNTKKINYKKPVIISMSFLIPFSVLSIDRNFDWKDEITLYRNDIKYLENSAKANDLLAGTLLVKLKNKKGLNKEQLIQQAKEVIYYYDRAIKVHPQYSNAWNNKGSVYFELLKDYKSAWVCFKTAKELNPDYEKAVFNYAHCSAILGHNDTAEFYYKKVLEKNPEHKFAWSALGNLYFKEGRVKKAIKTNETMMNHIKNSDIPYVNIGKYYLAQRDTLKAIPYLEKALQIRPDNYNLAVNLYNYFRLKGEDEKAIFYQNLVRKLNR